MPTYLLYLLVTASPVASSLRYAILAIVPWWPVTARGESLPASRRILIAVGVVAFGICCQFLWVAPSTGAGPAPPDVPVTVTQAIGTTAPGADTGRRWSVRIPLGIFLLTRLVDGLMIAWFAREQVASGSIRGWFVVHPTPASPGYLTALTNFDGQWYQQIAEHGYPTVLRRWSRGAEPWAFYPLYPSLVRGLMELTGLPFAAAATLVSMTCGAVAVCLLYRLLLRTGGRFTATATVLALCVYPAAPILQAAYTESLALLVIAVRLGVAGPEVRRGGDRHAGSLADPTHRVPCGPAHRPARHRPMASGAGRVLGTEVGRGPAR